MDDQTKPVEELHQQPAPGEQRQQEEHLLLQLWDENAAGMLRFGLALTGRREDAKEALQDAFTTVLGRLRMGDDLRDPRQALQQALCTAIELRMSRREVPAFEGSAPGFHNPDLDAPLRAAEFRRLVLHLVSPREFEMLQLRADGFSYSEIAGALAISPGTVASTLAKAIRKIRQHYSGGRR